MPYLYVIINGNTKITSYANPINIIDTMFSNCDWSYIGCVVKENVLYAIPCFGNNPLKIDMESEHIGEITEMKKEIVNFK